MATAHLQVPTLTDPGLAPDGGSVLECYVPLAPDAPMPDEAEVERLADVAIAALARRHQLDIAVRRIRGPRDFEGGMHLFDGRLYGLSAAVSLLALFPHQSPIRGLYLAGQTTYPRYRVSGATMSRVLAAERIVRNG